MPATGAADGAGARSRHHEPSPWSSSMARVNRSSAPARSRPRPPSHLASFLTAASRASAPCRSVTTLRLERRLFQRRTLAVRPSSRWSAKARSRMPALRPSSSSTSRSTWIASSSRRRRAHRQISVLAVALGHGSLSAPVAVGKMGRASAEEEGPERRRRRRPAVAHAGEVVAARRLRLRRSTSC